MFAFEPSESKIKKLHDDLVLSGKGLVFAELLSGNNFKPSFIYDTSISDIKNKKRTENLQNRNTRTTLLEFLIIFQVMIVVIILKMMGIDNLLKSFNSLPKHKQFLVYRT